MSQYDYKETVVLFKRERYDGGWPSSNLVAFIAWLGSLLDQIPAEYRASAKIEVDSVSSYGDTHYASLEISYERPPTKEEIAIRKEEQKERRRKEIEWAERQLARAKAGD